MDIFFSWRADDVGEHQRAASARDSAEELRRIAQACDFGARLWIDWVEAVGGSIVSNSEGAGRAQIPADKIEDLARRSREYGELLDSKVSMGVGTTVSEADRALELVVRRGGDQILFYSPDTDSELAGLAKAEADFGGAVGPASSGIEAHAKFAHGSGHSGIQAAKMPHGPGHGLTTTQQDPGSESGPPPPPEQTDAAGGLADQFHSLAQQQAQSDAEDAKGRAQSADEISKQVVAALKAIKGQAPILEQLKGQAPDLYQAVSEVVGAMVQMAHELKSAQPQQDGGQSPEMQKSEVDHAHCPKCGESDLRIDGGKVHCVDCGHADAEDAFVPLEKGKLPMPHAPNYHHLELPVGAEHDGKIKVHHSSGKTGWVEVRAGQVLSQDAHTISARDQHGA